MAIFIVIGSIGALIVFGVYKEWRYFAELAQTTSHPTQRDAYRNLQWSQGSSMITVVGVAQLLWMYPGLGLSWAQFQPIAGLLGLVWFLKPLQNLFEFDPIIKTLGRRLTFWGLARLWPLTFWPWSMIALAILDYAVIKQLRLRIKHQALFDSRQITDRPTYHAISMGVDGVMVEIIDPDNDESQINIQL